MTTLFGIRHTIRWAAHNSAEFDRRRLHGAGAWLFGQRPARPQRPPRRIVGVAAGAAWLSLFVSIELSGTSWGRHHVNGLATFLSYLLGAAIGIGAAGILTVAASVWRKRRKQRRA
jgi:hypothetical protein